MAFQNPTLLPWLKLRDNVMLPLKIVPPFRQEYRTKRKTEFRDRDRSAAGAGRPRRASATSIPGSSPAACCSAPRSAARSIHEPQLLMLDEPFGALDQFTREELWAIMQELWMTHRPTVLLVTHDLKEASYLANRICVMQARPGRIIDDSVVPFPRPRTIAMSYDPEFVAITQRLRELIVSATPEGGGPLNEQLRRHIASAALIIGFFVAWEILCIAFGVKDIVLPRPSPDPRHALGAGAGDLAARRADALHDAGRLRPRHRDRHRARRADRLVAARL